MIGKHIKNMMYELTEDTAHYGTHFNQPLREEMQYAVRSFDNLMLRVRPHEDSAGLMFAEELAEQLHVGSWKYRKTSDLLGYDQGRPEPLSFEMWFNDDVLDLIFTVPNG